MSQGCYLPISEVGSPSRGGAQKQEYRLSDYQTWAQILAPIHYWIWGKLFNLIGPQFPHDLNEIIMHKKALAHTLNKWG